MPKMQIKNIHKKHNTVNRNRVQNSLLKLRVTIDSTNNINRSVLKKKMRSRNWWHSFCSRKSESVKAIRRRNKRIPKRDLVNGRYWRISVTGEATCSFLWNRRISRCWNEWGKRIAPPIKPTTDTTLAGTEIGVQATTKRREEKKMTIENNK